MGVKGRGLPVWEKHLDKAVLAIAGLALVGAVTYQFSQPVRVEAGGQMVSLENAGQSVREDAVRLQGQVQSDTMPVQVPEPRDLEADAREQLASLDRVSTDGSLSGSLARGWQPVRRGSSAGVDSGATARYAAVSVPAPGNVMAGIFEGTVGPQLVQSIEGLGRYVGDEQPYDLRGVTVQASFDAGALTSALTTANGSGDPPPPERWWRSLMAVLDVQLVRERQQPDGSWGNRETVPPLPGQFSLRDRLAPDGRPALEALSGSASGSREAVRRTPIYPFISGTPWMWPGAESDAPDPAEIRRRAGTLLVQIRRLRGQIEGLNNRIDAIEDRDRGGDRGGRGERDNNDRPDPAARFREQLEEREEELDGLTGELRDLGFETDEQARELIQLERREEQATFQEPVQPLADTQGRITVWTHDISGDPGATYRYAVRVAVPNPLFGFSRLLDDEVKDRASQPVLYSALSEWSDPISVGPSERMFVTRANAAGLGLGGGPVDPALSMSSTVRLFRFYYGYWRTAETTVGFMEDVSSEIEVPEWPLFDRQGQQGGQPERTTPSEIEVDLPLVLLDVLDRGYVSLAMFGGEDGGVVERPVVGVSDRELARLIASVEAGEQAGVPNDTGAGRPAPRPDQDRPFPGDRDRPRRP